MTSVDDQARGASAAEALAGGGEMGALMRAFDWSTTPLGPVEGWPQALKTCVRLMLTSRQPMWLGWGDALTFLYNDPYRSIVGGKHPQALGQPTAVVWREIWADVAPRIQSALGGDEGTYDEALLLIMERHGYPEETYYTFSYSPIPDDDGRVAGIFCANTDDTRRVIGERQLVLLRDLAAGTAEARTIRDACARGMRGLDTNPHDAPFAVLYLLDPDQRRAVLAGMAHIAPGHPAAPEVITLDDVAVWPITEVVGAKTPRLISDLGASFTALPAGAWDRPPTQAVALPLTLSGQTGLAGILIVGLNPYRLFDDDYRGFLGLVAGQIAAAIASAQAYQEERTRAEALAELDRAKTAFFNNISHEFRTPLTLMLGPLEDVLAAPTDTALVREQVTAAHRNSLRLLRLVNTLLDFSRVEGARMEAVYEPTDLAALTAELAGVFRSAIERAGLRLRVDCPPLPEPVYVDREMWEKIVLNLLSNAFKFTFEGEIAVALRARDGSVALEVRDTGTGIPAEELPRLFERFHRVRGARARTHEGTGIGLALVQELARLHGGGIGVESTPGAGTTFTVTLPLGTARLPPERIQAARTQASTALGAAPYVEEALRWLPAAADTPDPQVIADVSTFDAARLAASNGAAPRARVLLADDNADLRDYLTRLLTVQYEAQAVANGAQALAAARAEPPDLILSDVMMPELDGLGLLRALRADPRTSAIPVVLLSARSGEESTVEGLQAGADDYLAKPFSARELLARVRTHIELARLRARFLIQERAAGGEAEAARQRLHDLFMQAPAIIAVTRGPDHVFEVANPLYVQSVGRHDPGELLNRPVREALPEVDGQGYFELLDQVYATGTPFVGTEAPVKLDLRGDGVLEEIFVNFVYQPYRNAESAVEGIFVHAVDVTEQVRARQHVEELARRLRAERDRLQQVVDLLPAAVVVTDAALTIQVSNRAVRALLGVDAAARRPPVETGEAVPADDAAAFAAYGARHLDGTPYRATEIPLARAALRGEETRGEQMLLRDAATGRDVPILVNAAPLRDEAGAILGGVVVFQDITGLRDLERAREEFLSSAAHDLKTPLTSIRGQTQLAQRRLARLDAPDAETAPLLGQLARIQEGTDTMLGLINELVDVTRQQMGGGLDLSREPIDLVALVRDSIAAQQSANAPPIELEARVPELGADVDAARIARVVGNLLSNAIKYSPGGGTITVCVAREDGAAGPEALIAVTDQGLGIPVADLPHIFDRFVRAGNVVGHIQGTGIGLASARGIVEQHGGTIMVESQEGQGTTFTVRLPLMAATADEP